MIISDVGFVALDIWRVKRRALRSVERALSSLVGTNRNVGERIPTLKIAVNTKPTARETVMEA